MKRLLCRTLVILFIVNSCSKSSSAPPVYPAAFYGNWQWIGSNWGSVTTTPSADTTIIVSLVTGDIYYVSLNGHEFSHGSFTVDTGANHYALLSFTNINQPAGDTTVVTMGNTIAYHYNYLQIGQLTLCQNNATYTPGDTLVLSQTPAAPEFTQNYFKRVQ